MRPPGDLGSYQCHASRPRLGQCCLVVLSCRTARLAVSWSNPQRSAFGNRRAAWLTPRYKGYVPSTPAATSRCAPPNRSCRCKRGCCGIVQRPAPMCLVRTKILGNERIRGTSDPGNRIHGRVATLQTHRAHLDRHRGSSRCGRRPCLPPEDQSRRQRAGHSVREKQIGPGDPRAGQTPGRVGQGRGRRCLRTPSRRRGGSDQGDDSPRWHRQPRRSRPQLSPRPCDRVSDSRGKHRRYLPVGRRAIALDAGSLLRWHCRRQQRGCPIPVDRPKPKTADAGPSPSAKPVPIVDTDTACRARRSRTPALRVDRREAMGSQIHPAPNRQTPIRPFEGPNRSRPSGTSGQPCCGQRFPRGSMPSADVQARIARSLSVAAARRMDAALFGSVRERIASPPRGPRASPQPRRDPWLQAQGFRAGHARS